MATDLNGDGKLDVVILHSIACFTAPCIAAETITVMLGNGDGTFQTRELAAPQHMHAMAAGDFNRDGIKDLAIGSENTKLHILLGMGDGTFVRQPEMTLIPGECGGRQLLAGRRHADRRRALRWGSRDALE